MKIERVAHADSLESGFELFEDRLLVAASYTGPGQLLLFAWDDATTALNSFGTAVPASNTKRRSSCSPGGSEC